jgi:transposase
VASLVAGHRVSGASPLESALAAVRLHLAGHKAVWIATRLGVGDRQVYRWLERYRAGKPLVPAKSRPRRESA